MSHRSSYADSNVTAKGPTETLQELDEYRYGEAITKYSEWDWDDPETIKPMAKADLNRLMAWKL